MLNKSDFILWLTETIKRLGQKSPKFFRTWGWVNLAMSGIGLIPTLLTFLEVELPATWMGPVGKIIFIAGLWGKIQSALAVSVPTPTVMPFTEKKQIQQELTGK